MSGVSRRGFVVAGLSFAAAGGSALAFRRLVTPGKQAPGRYGPLRPDPKHLFDLPEGFRYHVLDRMGEKMTDGFLVPGCPDAMGCFPGPTPDTIVVLRNHEVSTDLEMGAYMKAPAKAYSTDGRGGVTRLVLDARTFQKRSSNLALAGTRRNCAGGVSPWGWITCEETLAPGHGYAFLVDPAAEDLQDPRRLDGYGRYNHEAAAIDTVANIAYLTEDRADGCLYRFVPHDPVKPFEGRLQAMAVRNKPAFDTAMALQQGDKVELAWIDLEDTTPDDDSLRHRAKMAGASRVYRGEGIVATPDGFYVSATEGGRGMGGQVLRLQPEGDGGVLEVIAQPEDRDLLELPDNLAMHPSGDLYVCEDGPAGNHLRVIGKDGRLQDFGRHVSTGSELAGVCFSPDGKAMFLNIQQEDITLCITGPFA